LKEYLNTDYRSIVEIVELMDRLRSKIGLKEVSHYTTLQKFLVRIKSVYFNGLLKQTLDLFYSHGERREVTAIDSSGFSSGHCSYYYSFRTGRKRRLFLKLSISVDVKKGIVTNFNISGKPVHDANKGYDLENIHLLVREQLKAIAVVPLRQRKRKRIRGKYRRKLNRTSF
jgi:hypothetical protein